MASELLPVKETCCRVSQDRTARPAAMSLEPSQVFTRARTLKVDVLKKLERLCQLGRSTGVPLCLMRTGGTRLVLPTERRQDEEYEYAKQSDAPRRAGKHAQARTVTDELARRQLSLFDAVENAKPSLEQVTTAPWGAVAPLRRMKWFRKGAAGWNACISPRRDFLAHPRDQLKGGDARTAERQRLRTARFIDLSLVIKIKGTTADDNGAPSHAFYSPSRAAPALQAETRDIDRSPRPGRSERAAPDRPDALHTAGRSRHLNYDSLTPPPASGGRELFGEMSDLYTRRAPGPSVASADLLTLVRCSATSR